MPNVLRGMRDRGVMNMSEDEQNEYLRKELGKKDAEIAELKKRVQELEYKFDAVCTASDISEDELDRIEEAAKVECK